MRRLNEANVKVAKREFSVKVAEREFRENVVKIELSIKYSLFKFTVYMCIKTRQYIYWYSNLSEKRAKYLLW